jgi:hypothetical protein
MTMLPSRDRVAFAVVHTDPPDVYLAQDADVLTRVIVLEVIARTRPSDLRDPSRAAVIRSALLEEEWPTALAEWIEQTGTVVDAYPDERIWTDNDLDDERLAMELRVAPLFSDPNDTESG